MKTLLFRKMNRKHLAGEVKNAKFVPKTTFFLLETKLERVPQEKSLFSFFLLEAKLERVPQEKSLFSFFLIL